MKRKISIANIKNFLQQARPDRKILAVEIVGADLIGAVVIAKGKTISVRNFVSIERTSATDDLPDPVNISEIMERLDYYAGPVVLVTPLARSVQITMNRAKVDKLRNYQLCDALRWEVEPYTGIIGTQALVGAEKGSPAEQEELMLLTEEEDELDVNVSVTEKNVYRAMKQVFKRSGLKLVRLYPPEVCFFMPLFLETVEAARAVFDIGADYANFAIIKGNRPKQITTYSLGKDVLIDIIDGGYGGEAEQSLGFLLSQVPGPFPLLLTGTGATSSKIIDFLNARCEYGAESLKLSRSDKLGTTEHEGMNAMYAVAVGAAIREVSARGWRLIGITDAIPAAARVKESAYLVPLGATIIFVICLFSHYQVMKNTKKHHKARSAELSIEVNAKKQQQTAYAKLLQKSMDLEKETGRIHEQIAFIQGGSDDNLTHIDNVLRALFVLPPEMMLQSVSQEDKGYVLTGKSDDPGVVGRFAVQLQDYPWCRSAEIKALENDENGQLDYQIEMITDIDVAGVVATQ